MKFSSTPITSVQRCLNSLFQCKRPLFLSLRIFRRISQLLVRIHKMVNELPCRLPPQFFRTNLQDISSQISIKLLGLYLFPEHVLNFLSNLYIPTMVGKNFQICQNTGKCICESKIETRCFYPPFRQPVQPEGQRKPSFSPIQYSCRKE